MHWNARPEVHQFGVEQRQSPLETEMLVGANRIANEFGLALLQVPALERISGLLG